MKPFRIVVVADLHVGSVHALWPPKQRLPGGGYYEPNKGQQFLYKCWRDATRRIRRLNPEIVLLLGDAIQGKSIRDGQLVSNRSDVQVAGALKLLRPIREKCHRFYMVKGTPWHEGKDGEDLGLLAEALGAWIQPQTGEYSWWETYLQLPGEEAAVVHFAHAIGATKVSWYEGTVPLRDTLMKMSELQRWWKGQSPNLRLTVRAHRHRCMGIFIAPDIAAWTAPCWQLPTAYAHQHSIVTLPHIGWLQIDWNGQDLVVLPRLYRIPLPHVEEMTGGD